MKPPHFPFLPSRKCRLFLCLILLVVAIPLSAADRPDNEQPMYGGTRKPTVERNDANSDDAARRGWKAFLAGDLPTAMKRFNQSWLFNQENPIAYWGFGVVMGRRALSEDPEKNLRESVKLLDKAHSLAPDNGRITSDLAYSLTLLGQQLSVDGKDGSSEFARAGKLYAEAEALVPEYAPLQYNWAVLRFYEGDFAGAKTHLEKAVELGYKPDPAFVKDLEEKLR